MHTQSIEYLVSRIKDLQKQSQLQQDRIKSLQTQNQQLMAIVVQASHHNVNRNSQFIGKVEKLVMKKVRDTATSQNCVVTQRLKTQNSARKKSSEKYIQHIGVGVGKQNENYNKSKPYSKLNKTELQSQLAYTKRLQRRLA